MLAGMVSSLISMVIDKHSLYDHLKNQYLRDLTTEDEIKNENSVPVLVTGNNNDK
jgi:hypothetical protein